MSNNLYNSPFEMMLRVILLLSQKENEYFSEDKILILDFVSCYAAEFDLSTTNLHGNNDCKFAEFASRRMLLQKAIKLLVVKGLVTVKIKNGYLYCASKSGIDFAKKFESSYAIVYKKTSKLAIEKYGKESDKNILKLIH